jgi:pimeloyl-ACP methyl ester carboxylesterase
VKRVILLPGFLASDLGILATGEKLWWDPSVYTVLGIGAMRLGPDGRTPGPPDGQLMGVDTVPQVPWPLIQLGLVYQLDQTEWSIRVTPWDWRRDINDAAIDAAAQIRASIDPAEPVTLVGHSAGGLLAMLIWSLLVATGDQNKVRRIITICTPFQGSYGPITWLNGTGASVAQLLAVSAYPGFIVANPAINWSLNFLNALFLSWPCTYELFPSLIGSEAAADPNRPLLYQRANYPAYAQPSQPWLTFAQNQWQPQIAANLTFPPSWVATYVYGTGIDTAYQLETDKIPLDLTKLKLTNSGDGVVTSASATRSPGAVVGVIGGHSSVPLAITISGQLAKLITDPRGPPDPPPDPIVVKPPVAQNVTDPPQSDYVTGLSCLSGHCVLDPRKHPWPFII